MALLLQDLPAIQPEHQELFRMLGKWIISALDTQPAQAYTVQEIIPAVFENMGLPPELQALLEFTGIALDTAGLASRDFADLNEKRQRFVEAVLNTLLRDGELVSVVHEGTTYLHLARATRPVTLMQGGRWP